MDYSYLPSERRSFLKVGALAATATLIGAFKPGRVSAAVRGCKLPLATEAVTPFNLHVPQSQLDDLRVRLANVIWPNKETVDDWSQGVPLARMRELVDYWLNHYDWRRFEARLNAFDQNHPPIDRRGIHFF